EHKIKVLSLASAISFFSLYLFTFSYDLATAIIIWLVALMTLLSSVILSVKLNPKWIWVWGALCLMFVIIDFV
ncbi:MAG: hypothetical protein AAGC88_00005, partial [Bacteroidota bacterium]